MKNKDTLELKIFKIAIAFVLSISLFVYGVSVGKFGIPPYDTINDIYDAARDFAKFKGIIPEKLLIKNPDFNSEKEISIVKPDLMMEGYYIFLGWDDRNSCYSAKLYDHFGNLIFSWFLDYSKFNSKKKLGKSDEPHGFKVLKDGSLLLNFDMGNFLARIDSCGKPIWTREGFFHHSIEGSDDGSYWTWRGKGSSYSQFQYLVNFNPENGKIIREIGLIEDIIQKNKDRSTIFLTRPDYPFKNCNNKTSDSHDIFHPNDIEPLNQNLSSKFPNFEKGDLLISLRKPNLVAVITPDDLTIKWWSHGPWWMQHDPDFTKDGKISIYNNNKYIGRSEIIKIDLEKKSAINELIKSTVHFFSGVMGKHQYLPNENILIVVPNEGRILVLSPTGEKVMEYNNISKKKGYNGHVENGLWLPKDYFNKFPSCDLNQNN